MVSESNSLEKLNSTVGKLFVGAASVFEHFEISKKSSNDQGSLLFGLLPKNEKNLIGLIRRAQHFIKLVKEKNELFPKIVLLISVPKIPYCTKDSLQPLLENIRRFYNLHHGELSWKRCWKIKEINQSFSGKILSKRERCVWS